MSDLEYIGELLKLSKETGERLMREDIAVEEPSNAHILRFLRLAVDQRCNAHADIQQQMRAWRTGGKMTWRQDESP